MKLEDVVCSFELSRRLMELKIKQDSLFYWQLNNSGLEIIRKDDLLWPEKYSAFISSELGEMLPRLLATYKEDDGLFICCQFESPFGHREEEKTEADCRAKMLIHLIGNGLVKVEDFNV